MTTTAIAEVRASGIDPLGRGLDYLVKLSSNKTGTALDDGGFDLLTRQHKWHKDCFAATMLVRRKPRQAFSAVNQLFDFKLQGLSNLSGETTATYKRGSSGADDTAPATAYEYIASAIARFVEQSSSAGTVPDRDRLPSVPGRALRQGWQPEAQQEVSPRQW